MFSTTPHSFALKPEVEQRLLDVTHAFADCGAFIRPQSIVNYALARGTRQLTPDNPEASWALADDVLHLGREGLRQPAQDLVNCAVNVPVKTAAAFNRLAIRTAFALEPLARLQHRLPGYIKRECGNMVGAVLITQTLDHIQQSLIANPSRAHLLRMGQEIAACSPPIYI